MCCGQPISEAEAVAALEAPMERTHRVYTVTPGDARQVGTFGTATNETPALVPASVAAELGSSTLFRVEGPDAPAKVAPTVARKKAR